MNSVIIVAAGRGTRMNRKINKAFIDIDGKQMVAHTINTFYNCPEIDEIIVAVSKYDLSKFRDEILKTHSFKNIKMVIGGKERQDSIYNALKKVDPRSEIVLIHDGARPFIEEDTVVKLIEKTKDTGAAIVAVPVKDTVKVVDEEGMIESTPKRSRLWAAQTPQAFDRNIIVKAHEKAHRDGFLGTDDSMLVEKMGVRVSIVEGSYENIKITTPEDLDIAQMILNKQKKNIKR